MVNLTQEDVRRMLTKYEKKITKEFGVESGEESPDLKTKSYIQFRKEMLRGHKTWYEKGCNFAEKVFTLKQAPERRKELEEQLKICHLQVTPAGVESFAILFPLIYLTLGFLVSFAVFDSMFFGVFFLLTGVGLMFPLRQVPSFLATSWRMKASNQMVLCVFYIVTYMRHTSNLEGAINFASDHLNPPLSLDMKKIIWDVETGVCESVRESLDNYLVSWKKYNMEFIESVHLIESSLYEGDEERRIQVLDKALDIILTQTFERMLHYAQNLKSPITILHMLGIILPILGLVILPLVASFLGEIKWYHLGTLYNIILPISVYFMGKNILSRRPTGYGDTDISESNPELRKYRNVHFSLLGIEISIKPFYIALTVILLCTFIAFVPLIMFAFTDVQTLLAEGPFLGVQGMKFLDYRTPTGEGVPADQLIGPYGIGASLISLFFPFAFGIGLGIYYMLKSRHLIDIRRRTKALENEFASALFQLGSRLGDGMPAEMAFGKVGAVMEGTNSGKFFQLVSGNVRRLGMGLKEAIFNKKTGAILYFPSNVIDSSMRVMLESIRKGPTVASQVLLNVSRYIKEIHRVDERLKDLMADIVSSMQSNINFMAPVISGIVIGITSMITTILGNLRMQAAQIAAQEGAAGRVTLFATLFGDAIPTYFFQLVVGLYVVQIIYILTVLSNGIQNGSDSLNEQYLLGKNLIRSTAIYIGIAIVVIVFFNILAVRVLEGGIGGV